MFEQQLEAYIFQFADFIFGVFGRVINFCVGWGLFFGLLYVVARYLVCGNNKDKLSELQQMFGDAVKDGVEAFKLVMPAIKESAKCWAEDKIESLQNR